MENVAGKLMSLSDEDKGPPGIPASSNSNTASGATATTAATGNNNSSGATAVELPGYVIVEDLSNVGLLAGVSATTPKGCLMTEVAYVSLKYKT